MRFSSIVHFFNVKPSVSHLGSDAILCAFRGGEQAKKLRCWQQHPLPVSSCACLPRACFARLERLARLARLSRGPDPGPSWAWRHNAHSKKRTNRRRSLRSEHPAFVRIPSVCPLSRLWSWNLTARRARHIRPRMGSVPLAGSTSPLLPDCSLGLWILDKNRSFEAPCQSELDHHACS